MKITVDSLRWFLVHFILTECVEMWLILDYHCPMELIPLIHGSGRFYSCQYMLRTSPASKDGICLKNPL